MKEAFADVSAIERLKFLAEASNILASSLDYDQTLQAVARLTVPAFADWCGVYLKEPEGIRLAAVAHQDPEKVRLAYELDRRFPVNPKTHSGVNLVIETGRAEMISDLDDKRKLADLVRQPQHFEILKKHDIRSYICVPIHGRRNILGAIVLSTGESARRYNEDDLASAEDLARRAALAIDNARAYADSRRYWHLVNDLDAIVWEGDPETSRFTFVSARAESLLGYPVKRWIEEKDFWIGIIHPEDKEFVLRRSAEEGKAGRNYELEYRVITSDARTLWLHDQVYVVPEAKQGRAKSRGIITDVTARKMAEQELLQTRSDLERRVAERTEQLTAANRALQAKILDHKIIQNELSRKTAYSGLLESVAIGANLALSADEAVLGAITRICEVTGWPIGHVYWVSPESKERLLPSALWYLKDAGKYEAFCRITESMPLPLGVGLPGRILKSGRPHWIPDVTKDSNFPRAKAAEDIGVRAAFGFPVLIGQETVGVLEFFAGEVMEPDHLLLDLMVTVGSQLGRALERDRSQRALKDSETKLRSVLENSSAIIFAKDLQGRYILANRMLETLLQRPRSEIIGKSDHELFSKESAEIFRANDLKVLLAGVPLKVEETIAMKEGVRTYVATKFPLMDPAGVPYAVCGISTDITERKTAEEQIRRSQLDLARAQEIAHIGSWSWDVAHNKVRWSDELCRIYGLEPESGEISYENFLARLHPDDRAFVDGVVRTAFADGKPFRFEHRVVRPDGSVRVLDARGEVLRDAEGRVTGMLGIAQDITDRRAAEENLRAAQTLSERIVQSSIDGIVAFDAEFRCTLWNGGMERLSGAPKEKVVGKNLFSTFPFLVETGEDSFFREALAGKQVMAKDRSYVAANGKKGFFEGYYSPIKNDAGAVVGGLAIIREITERKRSDESLRQKTAELELAQEAALNIMEDLQEEMAERLKAEKEMVEVSGREQQRIGQDLHDGLSQQLTGISYMTKALEQRLAAQAIPEANDAAEIVQLVRKAIMDTKSLSRSLHPVELQQNGLVPALKELLSSSEKYFKVRCIGQYDETIEFNDHTTATHLYRIAQEAIHNAIKHGRATQIRLQIRREGGGMAMTLSDDGSGFAREAGEGAGMGLRNMRHRARMIDGALEIGTGAEGGAQITCRIPFANEKSRGSAPQRAENFLNSTFE